MFVMLRVIASHFHGKYWNAWQLRDVKALNRGGSDFFFPVLFDEGRITDISMIIFMTS